MAIKSLQPQKTGPENPAPKEQRPESTPARLRRGGEDKMEKGPAGSRAQDGRGSQREGGHSKGKPATEAAESRGGTPTSE